jgi:hypothetical protein
MQVQFTAKRPMRWVGPNHRGRLHTFLARTCSPPGTSKVHRIHISETLLVHFICKSAAACRSGCTYPLPRPAMNTFAVLACLPNDRAGRISELRDIKGSVFRPTNGHAASRVPPRQRYLTFGKPGFRCLISAPQLCLTVTS